MRHVESTRGLPHAFSDVTKARHLWTFDEAIDNETDLFGDANTNLTGNTISARQQNGWVGYYKSSDGVNSRWTSLFGLDHTRLTANAWTIGLVIRRRASAAATIFAYGSAGGTTDDYNILARLDMATDGGLTFMWESTGPTLRSQAIPSYKLPLAEWVYLHIIRTSSTQVKVYANGRLIATLDMVAANAGGANSLWHFAQNENSAGRWQGDWSSVYFETQAVSDLTVHDDVRRAFLWAFPTSVHAKFEIKDGAGNYRDLTNLEGYDWVESYSLAKAVENPCETLSLDLTREHDYLSLANLITDSKLNLTNVADLASYNPLVQDAREIRAYFARVPLGFEPATADWCHRFQGWTDKINWGSDPVRVEARDEAGRLVDDYLRDELDMPITSGVACAADPTTGERRASVEEAIQDLLNQFSGSPAFTLRAKDPANVCVIPWEQRKMSIMDASRKVAGIKAWDLRMMYDETPGSTGFKVTLYDPQRDRLDAHGVITRQDYGSFRAAERSVLDRRNWVRVTIGDKNNLIETPDGGTARAPISYDAKAHPTTPPASDGGIWRFMEITEDDTSPVNEGPEAQAMADGALADTKDPTVVAEVPHNDCFFELDLNDVLLHEGDNVHHTADQNLAVTAVRVDGSSDGALSSAGVRGKPTAGARRWLALDTRPGMGEAPWVTPDRPGWGMSRGLRRRITDTLLNRSLIGAGFAATAAMNRNSDFSVVGRGSSRMPDGWFRSTNAGVTATDPMTAGRLVTLPASLEVSRVSNSGARSIRLIEGNAPPQISSEMFPVSGESLVGVEYALIVGQSITSFARVYFYDANKVFISSTALTVASETRTITAIDDSGTGGAVRITTSTAHRLAVGQKIVVAGTTNYDGVYEVAVVDSLTQVTTVETKSGSLASEAVGVLGLPFLKKRHYETLAACAEAPGKARFAIVAFERSTSLASDFYLDVYRAVEIAPEFYARANGNTTINDNTWTPITLGTRKYDTGNDFASSTFTVPVTGIYEINAQGRFEVNFSSGTGDFDVWKVRLRANGTTTLAEGPTSQYEEPAPAASVHANATVQFCGLLNKGDTVTLEGYRTRVTGTIGSARTLTGEGVTFMRGRFRTLRE